MSRINSANMKKALTLQREKLLEELKYCERRIEEAKLNQTNQIEYEESSDSDIELPVLNNEPTITELKIQHSALQTCYDATTELTGLQVLQSEVNILVEEPKYDGEVPVTEEGLWREVIVECRVDVVPFSMNFYVHEPTRRFGGLSYRGLKITVLKKPHEVELSKTILHKLNKPSEAFEMLQAYSSACRSRRTSLAKLASMYSSTLQMAPLPEGGYQLKCGNCLELSWRLENMSSPVSPFYHKMKFELEYMDEEYIQTIKAANKRLSDPSIDTNERTSLLSKIITVCLVAQGINPQESNSESESTQSNLPVKRKRDEDTMGPPKTIPKKSRPKGKENKEDNQLNRQSTKDTSNRERGMENVNQASTSAKTNVDESTVKSNNVRKHEEEKKSKNTENTVNNKVVKEVSESNRKVSAKNSAKDSASNLIKEKPKENGDQIAKKDNEPKEKRKPNKETENGPKDNVKGTKENVESNKAIGSNQIVEKSKESVNQIAKKVSEPKEKRKPNKETENGAKDNVKGTKENVESNKVTNSASNQMKEKSKENSDQIAKKVNEPKEKTKSNKDIENRAKDNIKGPKENVKSNKVTNTETNQIKGNVDQITKKVNDLKEKKKSNKYLENRAKDNVKKNVESNKVTNTETNQIKEKDNGDETGKNVNEPKEKKKPNKEAENRAKDNIKGVKENVESNKVTNTETNQIKEKDNGDIIAKKDNELKEKKKSKKEIENRAKDNVEGSNDPNKVSNIEVKKSKDSNKKVSDVTHKKNNNIVIEKNGNKNIDIQNANKVQSKDKKASNDVIGSKIKDTEINKEKTAFNEKTHTVKKSIINRQETRKNDEGVKKNIEKTTNEPTSSKDNQFKKKQTEKQVNSGEEVNTEKTTKDQVIKTNKDGGKKILDAAKTLKKNPLRISPRKSISKPKSVSSVIRKPFTHLPRKSISKIKTVSPKIRKNFTLIPRLVSRPPVK